MGKDIRIYVPSAKEGALRQGEVITSLAQVKLSKNSIDSEKGPFEGDRIRHPFAVVVSQDCDLVWDFEARQQGHEAVPEHRLLPNVLFCETSTAESLKGREGINSAIWRTIKNNKDERYHFLEKVSSSEDALAEGLPELAIDFKRYFTMPTQEVYARLKLGAACRCRLVSPYLEHLSTRFYAFQSRVALPRNHVSE